MQKIQKTLMILSLIGLCLSWSGCGKEDGQAAGSRGGNHEVRSGRTSLERSLLGTWLTMDCREVAGNPSAEDGAAGRTFFLQKIRFATDQSFYVGTRYFSDAECLKPSGQEDSEVRVRYTLVSTFETTDGSTAIDFHWPQGNGSTIPQFALIRIQDGVLQLSPFYTSAAARPSAMDAARTVQFMMR